MEINGCIIIHGPLEVINSRIHTYNLFSQHTGYQPIHQIQSNSIWKSWSVSWIIPFDISENIENLHPKFGESKGFQPKYFRFSGILISLPFILEFQEFTLDTLLSDYIFNWYSRSIGISTHTTEGLTSISHMGCWDTHIPTYPQQCIFSARDQYTTSTIHIHQSAFSYH